MTYSRCSLKSVLDQVLAFSGQTSTAIDPTQTQQLLGFIYLRLRDWAWIGYPWPEIVLTERRNFRANYATGTAYDAPTATRASEVYFPPTRQYYQALKATTGNDPATLVGGAYVINTAYWALASGPYQAPDWVAGTAYAVATQRRNPDDGLYYQCHTAHTSGGAFDGSKFGVLTNFDPSIAKIQTWEANAIGEFVSIYLDDPRQERYPRRVPFKLDGVGAHITTAPFSRWGRGIGADWLVPNQVWVVFRLPCPVLRGAVYSAVATYVSGADIVYFAGTTTDLEGDFWQCAVTTTAGQSPQTTPGSWTRLDFPAWLGTPVARKVLADWLRYGGAREAAQAEDAAADDSLFQAQLLASGQQGQQMKWRKG